MKKFISLLAVLVLVYGLLCAFMYFRQREMIYFPQYTRVAASETSFSLERAGTTLRGWSVHPGRRDVVLYFGGNAESLQGMRGQMADWFPGHSSYLLAYRGYGASEGRPEEALLQADAVALYDHVRQLHPEGDISVIGRSLGTGVASYVASRRDVHRLVLIAPFDSLVGVGQMHYPWLPVRWLATEHYDSAGHLANYQGDLLILRAGRDTVVPPASTDKLIAGLPRPPKIIVSPSASHDTLLSHPDEARAVVDFLAR